jgi:hypothetical protein
MSVSGPSRIELAGARYSAAGYVHLSIIVRDSRQPEQLRVSMQCLHRSDIAEKLEAGAAWIKGNQAIEQHVFHQKRISKTSPVKDRSIMIIDPSTQTS